MMHPARFKSWRPVDALFSSARLLQDGVLEGAQGFSVLLLLDLWKWCRCNGLATNQAVNVVYRPSAGPIAETTICHDDEHGTSIEIDILPTVTDGDFLSSFPRPLIQNSG